MDMQTPDFATDPATTEASPLSRIFLKRLLKKLAAALPVDAQEHPEDFAEEWEAARELFFSMQPRTPLEAVLAARAVTCHLRDMDMSARVARPGISDEKAQRLNASASAAERSFDAALRALDKLRCKAAADQPAAKPADARPEPAPGLLARGPAPLTRRPAPIPNVQSLQPRGSHANPMPPLQRRAPNNHSGSPNLAAEPIAKPERTNAAAKLPA